MLYFDTHSSAKAFLEEVTVICFLHTIVQTCQLAFFSFRALTNHGVIYDFIQKLKTNPKELEILGDGTQNKSYLHINDCIDAILIGLEKAKNHVEIYNIDSEDQIDVKMIAQIVIEEMGLKNVKLTYTGGVDGGRGWKGDAENMLLDITKLKTLGWKPKLNTKQAITKAIKYLITELL